MVMHALYTLHSICLQKIKPHLIATNVYTKLATQTRCNFDSAKCICLIYVRMNYENKIQYY